MPYHLPGSRSIAELQIMNNVSILIKFSSLYLLVIFLFLILIIFEKYAKQRKTQNTLTLFNTLHRFKNNSTYQKIALKQKQIGFLH